MIDVTDRLRSFTERMAQVGGPKAGYYAQVPAMRLGDQFLDKVDKIAKILGDGSGNISEACAEAGFILMILSERQREIRPLSGPGISERRA